MTLTPSTIGLDGLRWMMVSERFGADAVGVYHLCSADRIAGSSEPRYSRACGAPALTRALIGPLYVCVACLVRLVTPTRGVSL